jgi:hypothetical protein
VLKGGRAVLVNIAIMRAFVKLLGIMATHRDLAHKIEALERKYATHDDQIHVIFDAAKKPSTPTVSPKRRIGFTTEAVLRAPRSTGAYSILDPTAPSRSRL